MNNVLEQTNLFATLKGKRIERIIGRVASKVRLTPATALSLRKNIGENKIDACIAKYNSVYTELRNAIVSAETAAAEQEARDSVLNGSKSKEEEQRNARILEDNTVAAITVSDVTKPRLSNLFIEVNKLQGRFGTLGNNYGVNVRESFIPKALSVPRIYSKIYKVILNNCDLYKLADKVVAIDSTVDETLEENTVANWRNLFDGVENHKKDVVVAMDGKASQDEEELEPTLVEAKGLSQEELSHRKMMGQIGDELQEVRRLKESSNGIGSPFSAGLLEREESLLSMLSSLSGVDEIAKMKPTFVAPKNNTEFQDLIEHLVGYKEPISEEEHKAMEEDMQEYYSDPDVSNTIDELRHKDVLYSFNQPESYNKVMEAERKDNERVAAQSTAVDLLDSDDEELVKDDVDDTVMSIGALKQAEMIQKENENHDKIVKDAEEQALLLQKNNERIELVEGAKEQAHMIQQEDEHREILDGAKEQARMIQQEVEHKEILAGAEEQAHMIQQEQELEEIRNGADEQARMLKTLYDYMDMQDALNKAQEDEREKILAGALEQAQMLQKENEKADLINGAEEQAREIVAKEEHDEILRSAKKEAYRLQATNDYIEIMGSANLQARMLLEKDEKMGLQKGANEQAKMLNDIPKEAGVMEAIAAQIVYQSTTDDDDLVEGAKEQAKQIQANNERADLLNGALEQAKAIVTKEEHDQLLEDADVQAREIMTKEEQNQLREGADEQARILFNNSNALEQTTEAVQVTTETQGVSIPSNNIVVNTVSKPEFEVISNNDRYGNIVASSKPIKLRQSQIGNMTTRLHGMSPSIGERRETLNSLKSQLESSDFDFLRYNEDLLQKSKAA